MAIIPLTTLNEGFSQYITWTPLANGDTGQPLENAGRYSDKTVQIFGTFGAGGSVTLEGSNDPRVMTAPGSAVWFALVDPASSAITKTSAAGEAVLENPRFIRPNVTAGDGTTALTVIIAAKGQ
jgi:hypothetical protein